MPGNARRDLRARRQGARHRHHRRPGQREVHHGRGARGSPAQGRPQGRDHRHRSQQPVLGRLDHGRPHPHERGRRGRGRLHPQHGHARGPRRNGAGDAGLRRHPGRRRLRPHPGRDGGRRAGRSGDRQRIAHHAGGVGSGPGRRDPGDQGRDPRDRRRPRGEQERSPRRPQHHQRPQADAGPRYLTRCGRGVASAGRRHQLGEGRRVRGAGLRAREAQGVSRRIGCRARPQPQDRRISHAEDGRGPLAHPLSRADRRPRTRHGRPAGLARDQPVRRRRATDRSDRSLKPMSKIELGNPETVQSEIRDWEEREVKSFLGKQKERKEQFYTSGGFPVKRTYTVLDVQDTPLEDVGLPGRFPFTRGPYPTMYRSRHWTMRQIAGFGTGEDTNKRFKYLIAQGQTGLSVDFDMPTLMGYDSDHPMSEGEVGREGVAVDTIADMEALFEGIDLEKISVSMTINPSAWILLAMYVVLAEKRGFDLNKLSGTIQADILKEYMAQKEYVFPIDPSVRIVRDCITWCARNMKRYNPINISGYHISEAGSSPLHEVAFTLCNLITYVEEVTKTGLAVDEFAPRLAFFFVCQNDFFEEIAKFRAARRAYAKIMRDRFGARNPESIRLRFHCQTAAASLTRPQYKINVIRTAFEALSAVPGGAHGP